MKRKVITISIFTGLFSAAGVLFTHRGVLLVPGWFSPPQQELKVGSRQSPPVPVASESLAPNYRVTTTSFSSRSQIGRHPACIGDGKNFLRYPFSIEENISVGERIVRVIIGVPDESPEKIGGARKGLQIIRDGFPYFESYFDTFPCEELYVRAFDNTAMGGPGWIRIGGVNGGIDHPWLLYHELTHSYFSSAIFSSWFAEGAATFIPYVILFDQARDGNPWKNINFDLYPNGLKEFVERVEEVNLLNDLQKDNITEETPLCEVENNRRAGSNLGRLFFHRLYLVFEQKNFLRVLHELYVRYRTTGEVISHKDVYDEFLTNAPDERRQEIQSFLKMKLCI